MATLKQLWRGFTAPAIPARTAHGQANQPLLAYRMSLVALLTSVFFVWYSWVTDDALLTWINLAMTGFYLAALLLLRANRSVGKTLLVAGVSLGIFLVASVVGKTSGNYLLYFPVICGIFLLFSIRQLPALIGHLALPVVGLLVLQWTDYRLLVAYRPAATDVYQNEVHLVVSLVTMGLALYYAQRVSLTAEKALRESQQSLLAIIENTTNAIWSIDRTYRVITCNSTLKNEFRYAYGVEIEKGANIFDSITPEERATWYGICGRAFAGERFTQEMHYDFPGRTLDVEVAVNPIKGTDGSVIGVSFFSKNITKRKQAEETIRATNQKLTAILENSQNIIFAVDRDYRYLAFNHQHREAVRQLYNVDVRLGMGLRDFTTKVAGDRDKIFGYLDRALAGEQFIVVEPFGDANLVRRHFEHAFTPMRDEGGNVVGVTVFSLDISERIEAEEELRRINFELDSFVYRSSHDLRAPLRSVLGLVSLVRAEEDGGQREYYLRLMEKSIDKLDTFIRDMTDFSRNSRQEVLVAPVDFRALLAECADNLRYMEHADRVSLRVEVEGDGFYSDPQRISTVFQNLMSNAVKYQRLHISDAFVAFRIRCTAREAQIVCTDNGKGIENAYLDKIFDMFYRASADSYGSGLGLYITRQVVKKLNGTIRVQSQPGQGTEFTITLPNLRPAVAAPAAALPPATA